MKATHLGNRSAKLGVILVAAASAVSGAAIGAAEDRRPTTTTITFKTPGRRSGTVTFRADRDTPGGWCGAAVVNGRGKPPAEREDCGGSPGESLHGPFLVDCTAREAIVFGAVADGVRVSQSRGRRPRIVAETGSRPRGVRFAGRLFAIGVDLRRRPAILRATGAAGEEVDRHDFREETRRCSQGGLAIVGGI